MRTSIEHRALKDGPTENGHTTPPVLVTCKQCNRYLATLSAKGPLVPFVPHEQTCASCELFLRLYNALKASEEDYIVLLDRGPKHHGRIRAYKQFRRARIDLENFLISVCHEATSLQRIQDPEEAEAPKLRDAQKIVNGTSPDGVPSIAASSARKRRPAYVSRIPRQGRKRIRFDKDVKERPEYRKTLEFHRRAGEYVPGRYAASKGREYQDTSGYTMSFVKFTGQKKPGSKLVEVAPKDETFGGEEELSALAK